MTRIQPVAIAAAALSFVLAACGGTPAPAANSAADVTVEAREFQFQPSRIEAVAGRAMRIRFQNRGSLQHDFSILSLPMTGMRAQSAGSHDMGASGAEPQLHVTATSGKDGWVEFTPTQAGTYDIFCTVPGHREAGMAARLEVKAQ
jgi:uncharacterized cupredoxin-like copper-binding protein